MGEEAKTEDTISLLKECSAGCKTASNTIEQVMEHVKNEKLMTFIRDMDERHIKLGEESHSLLSDAGEQDEDPKGWAKAMAWATTGTKMALKNDSHQAAAILMDGCHMGIKSLSEYYNKYDGADSKSRELCDRIRNLEKEMMDGLEQYL